MNRDRAENALLLWITTACFAGILLVLALEALF